MQPKKKKKKKKQKNKKKKKKKKKFLIQILNTVFDTIKSSKI